VHLVGEAALALAPRLGAAWGERLSMSAGAVGLVTRGDPRPSPLPWYLAYVARVIRALPAAWHVALHAVWDGIFSCVGGGAGGAAGGGGGYLDVVGLCKLNQVDP
jgi:hypothetical protein